MNENLLLETFFIGKSAIFSISLQMKISYGRLSTITNGRVHQSSFKYLDDDGKLTVKSQDVILDQELPPPDYDRSNPVFTNGNNEEGIEVNYHHVLNNDSCKIEDSDPMYQTPPYDTFGYNRASSPRAMYSNPIYSVVKPKTEQKKDDNLGPYSSPMYDSYGYHRGSSPREMYAKEFGEINNGYDDP